MPKLDKDGKRELFELDEKIRTVEKELHRLHEARREVINYYGLNKQMDRENQIKLRITEAINPPQVKRLKYPTKPD